MARYASLMASSQLAPDGSLAGGEFSLSLRYRYMCRWRHQWEGGSEGEGEEGLMRGHLFMYTNLELEV